MTKVSIIIPIYNQEKYLQECLLSVANQIFVDFEAILIDDGSSDGSAFISKKFVKQYPFFKYFYQENSGVSVARNKGIEEASGEYLYFLDSDDTISPDFLESVYTKAKEKNADFVVCGETDWNESLDIPPCVWTGSCFVKSELLKQYSIKFPENIQPCEDGLFSNFCLAVSKNVLYLPKAGYFHREYEISNSKIVENDTKTVLEQVPKWLNCLEVFYLENNLLESKNLHFALFFQKEPFARFSNVELYYDEGKFLYDSLKEFYNLYIKEYSSRQNEKYYNWDFKLFIKSPNFLFFLISFFVLYFLKYGIFSLRNLYKNNKKEKTLTILGIRFRV